MQVHTPLPLPGGKHGLLLHRLRSTVTVKLLRCQGVANRVESGVGVRAMDMDGSMAMGMGMRMNKGGRGHAMAGLWIGRLTCCRWRSASPMLKLLPPGGLLWRWPLLPLSQHLSQHQRQHLLSEAVSSVPHRKSRR